MQNDVVRQILNKFYLSQGKIAGDSECIDFRTYRIVLNCLYCYFCLVLLCFVIRVDMVDRRNRLYLFVSFDYLPNYIDHPNYLYNVWFLFWCSLSPNGFIFIVRLCSIPFSRRIAYSCASCWVRVCANSSSANFSLCMCAVNMSLSHSSSLFPQSAREANSTRFA